MQVTREQLEKATHQELLTYAKVMSLPTRKITDGELVELILIKQSELISQEVENKAKVDKEEVKSVKNQPTDTTPQKRGRPKKVVEPIVERDETAIEVTIVNTTTLTSETIEEPKVEEKDFAPLLEGGYDIRSGVLDVHAEGYGFIRVKNCEPNEKDAYLSAAQIKKVGLRRGDYVTGKVKDNEDGKPGPMIQVTEVNGVNIEESGSSAYDGLRSRLNFDELVPIYPNERFKLEIKGEKNDLAVRSVDIIAPIGKGQRAMIVSPPKAGKTTFLKKVANSISANYPDVELFVLLIDERPEEVTDMQRSIKGEVVYSTFDEMPEHHTKCAELVLARAKRLVELGRDVVILMDSLTRLARAYNLTIPPTGRTLSGGIDPGALHSPKRFFGSARNIENGGSLTIIATALVDTGSRMDDVIYEEFKGTGNMEIHLDRKLSEKRIFPAIDLNRSSTRREELLLTPYELECAWSIRKLLSRDAGEATESLIKMMMKTSTNEEFMKQLNLQMQKIAKEGYTIMQ